MTEHTWAATSTAKPLTEEDVAAWAKRFVDMPPRLTEITMSPAMWEILMAVHKEGDAAVRYMGASVTIDEEYPPNRVKMAYSDGTEETVEP